MKQTKSIVVKGTAINVLLDMNQNDYICLTDMTKGFEEGSRLIEKWLGSNCIILIFKPPNSGELEWKPAAIASICL